MQKSLFVVRGVSNSGKSHTVCEVRRLLENYFKSISVQVKIVTIFKAKTDQCVIIVVEMHGIVIRIAICPPGDSPDIIRIKLSVFADLQCDIIVCGCKDKQGEKDLIFTEITKVCARYAVHVETTKKTRDLPADPIKHDIAKSIFTQIRAMLP